MTFGQQNTEAHAHAQLDMAVDHGVNFLDAAEMYPFPSVAELFGRTEGFVGSWLARPGNRRRMVVATKITGPGPRLTHICDGDLKFNQTHLAQAVDDSLKRPGINCIDLYQTHFPERPSNYYWQTWLCS